MMNKKGQLVSAMQALPAVVMAFLVFSIVLVVGLKIVVGLQATMTTPAAGVSAFDNNTYNNMTIVLQSMSNFTTNAGLVAVIAVMAVVLMIVIAAFSFRRSEF